MKDKEIKELIFDTCCNLTRTTCKIRKKICKSTEAERAESKEIFKHHDKLAGLIWALYNVVSASEDLERWNCAEEEIDKNVRGCAEKLIEKINALIKNSPAEV